MINLIDTTHEITNQLQHDASIKRTKETEKIQAYYEGYIQACEDFGRRMRSELIEQSNGE